MLWINQLSKCNLSLFLVIFLVLKSSLTLKYSLLVPFDVFSSLLEGITEFRASTPLGPNSRVP